MSRPAIRQKPIHRGRIPTPGGVVYAASAAQADVADAVAAANPGDTVYVPAGTANWTQPLAITKPLSILGAGSDQTTIIGDYDSGSTYMGLFHWVPNPVVDGLYRLSGFAFDLSNKSYAGDFYSGVSTAIGGSVSGHGLRIDHNTFTNVLARRCFYIKGQWYGCIDSNTFTLGNSGTAFVIRGYLVDDAATMWGVAPLDYGAATNLYFEDNVLTGGDVPIATGQGGRYVCRYNTFGNVTKNPCTIWDAHGNQPAVGVGTMVVEIYGNTVDAGTNSGYIFDQRGGKALMFANVLTGGSILAAKAREEYADDYLGSSYTMHVQDSYYWMNFCNGSLGSCTEVQDVTPGAIAENVDFFNQQVPFDGSVGMGVGTLAERPESASLTNAGYWATNQNTTTLTGMVGADPTTALSGTLWRWNGAAWSEYYTPYEYPHPLRSL